MKESKKIYNSLKRKERKILNNLINKGFKNNGDYNYFYEYLLIEEFKPFLIESIIKEDYFKYIPGYEEKFIKRLNKKTIEKQAKFLEDIIFFNEDYDEWVLIDKYKYLLKDFEEFEKNY